MPFDAKLLKPLEKRDNSPAPLLNNRELRERTLLSLARKFKPHLAKALKQMINLVEDEGTPANVRYQASKFVIEFYSELGQELYKDKYDKEVGTEIQTESAPVFSLTMVKTESKE